MIQTTSKIPMPSNPGRTGRPAIYPWDGMDVGDSFFVAGKTSQNLVAPAAFQAKSRGWKFTTRTQDGGVRVWRTA